MMSAGRARPSGEPIATGHRHTALGFTLLELLIAMVIIGLLTGIVGPRFFGQISRSEVITARSQIEAIDAALQAFRLDMGRYPESSEGLHALIENSSGDVRWRGPYLAKGLPDDPWGMPYQYQMPSQLAGKGYDLSSFGRDRAPGGVGEGADILL